MFLAESTFGLGRVRAGLIVRAQKEPLMLAVINAYGTIRVPLDSNASAFIAKGGDGIFLSRHVSVLLVHMHAFQTLRSVLAVAISVRN